MLRIQKLNIIHTKIKYNPYQVRTKSVPSPIEARYNRAITGEIASKDSSGLEEKVFFMCYTKKKIANIFKKICTGLKIYIHLHPDFLEKYES